MNNPPIHQIQKAVQAECRANPPAPPTKPTQAKAAVTLARDRAWPLRRILLGSLRRRFVRVAVGMVVAVGAWVGAATPALAASSSFGYSSGYQYFTVPSGVYSVHFDVTGGAGANGQGTYGPGKGGSGADVTGDYWVSPGWVLQIWAGGAGQPGGGDGYGNPTHDDFDGGSGGSGYGIATGSGGGGGAASYVKLPTGDILALAGGGGGGGGGGTANTTGGDGSDGAYQGASQYSQSWDASTVSGGNTSAYGGFPNATSGNNGVNGNGGGNGFFFGGGGGGGGGGYQTCISGASTQTGVYCFGPGGGGQGGSNDGGGGGAGGNSYADHSATNVHFASSGNAPSTAGRVTLSYGSPSSTTVTASSANSSLGQSVRFTADVNPSDGGGTVTFSSDAGVIPGCSNLSFEAGGGSEWLTSCSTSALPAGTNTITATYSGDGNYQGSSSSTTETVQQATSSTTLSASPATSSSGRPVTFTASVDPSDGGGDVTFKSDGLLIPGCIGLPLSAGGTNRTASCTTSSLSVGTHTITAGYSGDRNYADSSASTTETVQWATSTSLKASPSSLPIAGVDKLTATIAPSDGSGTVAFTQNGQPISGCAAVPLVFANGAYQAVCKHAWSAPDTYSIVASYSGDSSYAPSSATTKVTVTPAPIVFSVTPKAGSTAGGQSVTITGSYLTGVTTVSFGKTLATNVTVLSGSELTATVPAHAAGTVNVTVTASYGTSAAISADHYTYDPVPTVSSLDPGNGTKGTVVTVSGTGFVSGAKVAFGTSPASKVVRVSSTQLRATAPAGSGSVPVMVTTPGGTSATSPADQFTYTAS